NPGEFHVKSVRHHRRLGPRIRAEGHLRTLSARSNGDVQHGVGRTRPCEWNHQWDVLSGVHSRRGLQLYFSIGSASERTAGASDHHAHVTVLDERHLQRFLDITPDADTY